MRIVILSLLFFSCTKTPHLTVSQKSLQKANFDLSDSFEKLNKIKIIQPQDKIDTKRKIVCQYIEDYQEEVQNYRKILDIVKKYQLVNIVSKE